MFYQKNMDNALRFGDVLRGYIAITPSIKEPILAPSTLNEGYNIDVNLPLFSVVISPCCSIGEKTISLSPLVEVRGSFFDNPYLAEDLTRINRKMEPQQTVSPQVWGNFPPEEKQRRFDVGSAYAFIELFVYEKNDLFRRYSLHRRNGNIETNYHMIDFRNTYKLSCEKIRTPKDAPLDSKCLQLSIQARSELRYKISDYYGRIPKEDKILED